MNHKRVDRLHGGSMLWVFTVMDVYAREGLAVASAFRMGAVEVVVSSPEQTPGLFQHLVPARGLTGIVNRD